MNMKYHSKYLLLGILLLFFLILIAYEIYEGFDDKPIAVGATVRNNKTCSDPDMAYMIDRFDKGRLKPATGCDEGAGGTEEGASYPNRTIAPTVDATGNAIQNGYFSYCLPKCQTLGPYTTYSNDPTYCVRTDNKCALNRNLSNSIEDNWARVCGPLYKTNVNLMSTMGSISTVVSTVNGQYSDIHTNFPAFSNSVTTNASGLACNSYLRDTIFNQNIISNYYDLTSFNNSISSYWIELSNKKNKFDGVFNSFNCANYM